MSIFQKIGAKIPEKMKTDLLFLLLGIALGFLKIGVDFELPWYLDDGKGPFVVIVMAALEFSGRCGIAKSLTMLMGLLGFFLIIFPAAYYGLI